MHHTPCIFIIVCKY